MKVTPAFIVMSRRNKIRITLSNVDHVLNKDNLSISLVPLEYFLRDYRFHFSKALTLDDFDLYSESGEHILSFSIATSFLENNPVFGILINFSFSSKRLGAAQGIIIPVVYLPGLRKQATLSSMDFYASVDYGGPLLLRRKNVEIRTSILSGNEIATVKVALQKVTSSGLVPIDVGYINIVLPRTNVEDLRIAPKTSINLGINRYKLTYEFVSLNNRNSRGKTYELLVIYIPWYIMLLGIIVTILLLVNLIKLIKGGYGKNKS